MLRCRSEGIQGSRTFLLLYPLLDIPTSSFRVLSVVHVNAHSQPGVNSFDARQRSRLLENTGSPESVPSLGKAGDVSKSPNSVSCSEAPPKQCEIRGERKA